MEYTHRVHVPDEFFAKSKSEYNDWRFAFLRELIQNSYDAGATELNFSDSVDAAGNTVITCADNGSGMTKDVITGALLVLGGSHKSNGAVGGFGYAKNLLFFAHHSYTIHTQNWLVTGKGGSYRVEPADKWFDGTHITVTMTSESGMCAMFHSMLLTYARKMNPSRPLTIKYNGSVVPLSGGEGYQFVVEQEAGVLRFNDIQDSKKITLTVLVNGLPMFSHSDWGDRGCTGVFELKGASYDVLTTNREGFRGDIRQQFVNIIHEVIFNRFTLRRKPLIALLFNPSKHVFGIAVPQFDMDIQNANFPQDFLVHIVNEKKESTRESVTEAISFAKKAWVQRLSHTFKFYIEQVLKCDYAVKNGITTLENNLVDVGGNIIRAGFTLDPDLEGVTGASNGVRHVMCNPQFFSQKFWHSDVLDIVFHELAHLWASGHGETFVDVEMKLRRSFRRFQSETEVKAACKAKLKSLGFNDQKL